MRRKGQTGHHDVTRELSNALVAGLKRRLDFIHMPAPIERDDDAYFAPLRDLRGCAVGIQSTGEMKRGEGTKLYLGLIHERDGVEGTMRRHATAGRHCQGFGVSTECGFGRMAADALPGILATHEQVMHALDTNGG